LEGWGAANPRRARRSASRPQRTRGEAFEPKDAGEKKVLPEQEERLRTKGTRFESCPSKKGRGFGVGPRLQKGRKPRNEGSRIQINDAFLRHRPEKTQAAVKKAQAAVEKDGRCAPFATDVRCALVTNTGPAPTLRRKKAGRLETKGAEYTCKDAFLRHQPKKNKPQSKRHRPRLKKRSLRSLRNRRSLRSRRRRQAQRSPLGEKKPEASEGREPNTNQGRFF